MPLEAALFLRDGIKDTGNAMAYVIADYITHVKRRQQHTGNRVNEKHEVCLGQAVARSQQSRNEMDEAFEQHGGESARYAGQQGQKKHKRAFRQMLLAPKEQLHE